MDTPQATTHIGLCAGYGGIELGLSRVLTNLRSVALCEIEGFAIANLVAKMEAGLMDPAPIWPDLKTFPWGAFRDRVDILTGGYPCQPFSAAGKRAGKDDPRHLWPYIADGIRLLRPRCCFFENVEGHITLGLSDVIEDLAGMGYRTTWGIFSAAECGAPHQRKRVFILAHKLGTGLEGMLHDVAAQGREDAGRPVAGCGEHRGDVWPSCPGEQQYEWEPPRVVADAKGQRSSTLRSEHEGFSRELCAASTSGEESVADSHRIDRSAQAEGREHDRQAGPAGEELADSKKSGRISQRIAGDMDGETSPEGSRGHKLAPTIADCGDAGAAEAMGYPPQRQDHGREPGDMGTAPSQGQCVDHAVDGAGEELADTCILDRERRSSRAGWRERGEIHDSRGDEVGNWQAQPPMGGDADGTTRRLDYAELCVSGDNRTDELRLLGNGVVPATAERAFRVLMAELFSTP